MKTYTIKQIAEKMGVSIQTIHYRIKSKKIKLNKMQGDRYTKRIATQEQMDELLSKGKPEKRSRRDSKENAKDVSDIANKYL